jgi:hypothetical protein
MLFNKDRPGTPVMERNKMKRHIRNRVIGLAAGTVAFGAISACGGAGGDGGLDVADGGIRGTGSSVGPVSGFGSVFVNGVRFDTENLNRSVVSNDGITAETELREGMILRVEGEWRDDGQGTAESLEYDDTFRGRVSDPLVSSDGKTVKFSMYGQHLFATTQTVFRGTTLMTLSEGDFVRVSAYRGPDGRYRASFIGAIEENDANIELEVNLSNIEIQADVKQFTVNDFTVSYDDAEFADGLDESDLENGGFYEIEGEFMASNRIHALSIARDDFRRYQRGEGDDVELTGTIQSDYTPSGTSELPGEFILGGLTIRVTSNTEFDDGLTTDRLREGLLVQVEGDFTSDTVVEAEEIELREADSKVQGVISQNSVSPSTNRFVIGGVTVQVTPLTILTLEDGGNIEFAGLPQETVTVEVDGIERGAPGDVYIEALKVEVDDEFADPVEVNEFELEGRVTQLLPDSITVLGLNIRTTPGAFEDNNAFNEIDALLQANELVTVEIEYFKDGNQFFAEEIELEEDDDD